MASPGDSAISELFSINVLQFTEHRNIIHVGANGHAHFWCRLGASTSSRADEYNAASMGIKNSRVPNGLA